MLCSYSKIPALSQVGVGSPSWVLVLLRRSFPRIPRSFRDALHRRHVRPARAHDGGRLGRRHPLDALLLEARKPRLPRRRVDGDGELLLQGRGLRLGHPRGLWSARRRATLRRAYMRKETYFCGKRDLRLW